jgi:hypothetical protein
VRTLVQWLSPGFGSFADVVICESEREQRAPEMAQISSESRFNFCGLLQSFHLGFEPSLLLLELVSR